MWQITIPVNSLRKTDAADYRSAFDQRGFSMTKHVAGISTLSAVLAAGALMFAGPASAADEEGTVEMPDVRGMSLAAAYAEVAGLDESVRIPTGTLDMNGLARQQLSPRTGPCAPPRRAPVRRSCLRRACCSAWCAAASSPAEFVSPLSPGDVGRQVLPVSVVALATRSSGVPSKTTRPPSWPAPGPRSMIQSACAITA